MYSDTVTGLVEDTRDSQGENKPGDLVPLGSGFSRTWKLQAGKLGIVITRPVVEKHQQLHIMFCCSRGSRTPEKRT